MKIYNYNGVTGEFIGESTARKSPLEDNVYLIPANATKVKPPSKNKDTVSVFKDSEWLSVADYRGQVFYSKEDRSTYTPSEIGWEPDSTLTTKEIRFRFPKWSGKDWEEDGDLTIMESIKELEGLITNRRIREAILTDEGKGWLENVDRDIESLRASLGNVD